MKRGGEEMGVLPFGREGKAIILVCFDLKGTRMCFKRWLLNKRPNNTKMGAYFLEDAHEHCSRTKGGCGRSPAGLGFPQAIISGPEYQTHALSIM